MPKRKTDNDELPQPARVWLKLPHELRRKAAFKRLTLEERGAFFTFLLSSLGDSLLPGMFLESDDTPLSPDAMAFGAALNAAEVGVLQTALASLCAGDDSLLTWSGDDGFAVRDYARLYCAEPEIRKLELTRAAWSTRQQRRRARLAATQGAAETPAKNGSKPAMRIVASAKGARRGR